ncbi:MAG TPA: YkgJ family cysteine cluster protein [Verrucomicrobiae bacterium]|nr:YkgJ family cysteine cluster protein [Verrucomicrobiae bacterium]
MKALPKRKESRPEDLCLSCGLCCNGVLFADVKLQPPDDPKALRVLGMPLQPDGRTRSGPPELQRWRFLQPCAAFDGCRCSIYASRPLYCRKFECLLFKDFDQGKVTKAEALSTIRTARKLADKVDTLLRGLEPPGELRAALAARFRRTAKRLERSELDSQSAGNFGRLTVAYHQLTLVLRTRFYPSPIDSPD